MGLIVKSVPDLRGGDKEIEWVINILVIESFHLFVLGVLNSFLLVS